MKRGFFSNLFTKQPTQASDLPALAFLHTLVAAIIIDEQGEIILLNEAAEKLTGYERLQLEKHNISVLASNRHDTAFYDAIWQKLHHDGSYEGEVWARRRSGEERRFSIQASRLEAPWLPRRYYVIALNDVTDRYLQNERYLYLANHDPLTGLANRALLDDRLRHAISNAARSAKKVGVLLLDLNEFKQINDTYGHAAGDGVLQYFAKTIEQCIRANDTAGRLGGDEFLVILEFLDNSKELDVVIEKIGTQLDSTVRIDDAVIDISYSVGKAIFPDNGTDAETLLQSADNRLYREKAFFYGLHEDFE